MPARITKAEARALGLSADGESTGSHRKAPAVRKRKPKLPYHTRCKTCGEEFTTAAAEDRHVHDLHHARYEVVIERNTQ